MLLASPESSLREGQLGLDSHCVECIFCQEPMQLGKRWSLLRLPAPAPKHQLIQAQWAGMWPGQVHLHYAAVWTKGREQMFFSPSDDRLWPSQSPRPIFPPLSSDLPTLVPEELPCVLNDLFISELPKGLGPAEHQHLP